MEYACVVWNPHTEKDDALLGLSQLFSKICPICSWEFPEMFTYYAVHFPIMPVLCSKVIQYYF